MFLAVGLWTELPDFWMRVVLVPGVAWESWWRQDAVRRRLDLFLKYNFFQERYEMGYVLSACLSAQGELVGVACFYRHSDLCGGFRRWELVAIEVAPPWRRLGAGRLLIQRFARRAALGNPDSPDFAFAGAALFVKTWFSNALPFYTALGFRRRTIFTRSIADLMPCDASGLLWLPLSA